MLLGVLANPQKPKAPPSYKVQARSPIQVYEVIQVPTRSFLFPTTPSNRLKGQSPSKLPSITHSALFPPFPPSRLTFPFVFKILPHHVYAPILPHLSWIPPARKPPTPYVHFPQVPNCQLLPIACIPHTFAVVPRTNALLTS